jgi:hypothetical protein
MGCSEAESDRSRPAIILRIGKRLPCHHAPCRSTQARTDIHLYKSMFSEEVYVWKCDGLGWIHGRRAAAIQISEEGIYCRLNVGGRSNKTFQNRLRVNTRRRV